MFLVTRMEPEVCLVRPVAETAGQRVHYVQGVERERATHVMVVEQRPCRTIV